MSFGLRFFFPSLYRKIKDQNLSISEDFTKTFLKWPRDRMETTWRQCWSFRAENVPRKLLRIPYRLRLFVSFCESSDWDWMKHTRNINTEEHADTSTWKAAAALAKYIKTVDTLPQARWRRELVFAEVVRLECVGPHWPVGYEVPEVPGAGLR